MTRPMLPAAAEAPDDPDVGAAPVARAAQRAQRMAGAARPAAVPAGRSSAASRWRWRWWSPASSPTWSCRWCSSGWSTASTSTPSLLVLPVALLLAYGASRLSVTLFTELRQVVFARVMARVSRRVTLQVFRHLHALSLRFHLARRTGGVARDVERGGSAISDLLDWTLYTIVPTIARSRAGHRACWCGPTTGASPLITLATLVGLHRCSPSRSPNGARATTAPSVEADTHANERAVDSLLNYETVKYFGNEEHEARRYDENLRAAGERAGHEPQDAGGAQPRPDRDRRDRRHRDDVARRGRRGRRHDDASATWCWSTPTCCSCRRR